MPAHWSCFIFGRILFFNWIQKEVAALPEIFVGVNENFVAIALEG
jgi:hypothetical protein